MWEKDGEGKEKMQKDEFIKNIPGVYTLILQSWT